VEPGRIFLDVDFDRYKFLIDEGCKLRVSVRFGFQPSTCPSRWSGAEVNQHGLVLCFCLAERNVYVFVPRYCHLCSPEIELPQSMHWMRGDDQVKILRNQPRQIQSNATGCPVISAISRWRLRSSAPAYAGSTICVLPRNDM
jgi:hypothetical protein